MNRHAEMGRWSSLPGKREEWNHVPRQEGKLDRTGTPPPPSGLVELPAPKVPSNYQLGAKDKVPSAGELGAACPQSIV